MKFTCDKAELSSAITTVSRAAAVRSPIPALEGILLEATVSVNLTGFDLKKGIYTTLEASVTESGSLVLGARLLGEIVKKLPDGPVFFSADEKSIAVIRGGNAEFSIIGTPAEDYPELPSMDYKSTVALPQDVLAQMIQQTNFAVSDNESRPIYTGSLFEIQNDELTLVAVDGFRLALRREPIDRCDVESCSFVVPGSALGDLEKICSNTGEEVRITVGSKHVSFTVGSTVLVSRLLEGEFLNYRKTVPTDFPVTVDVERADLIRSVERVSLVIDDRTKNPLRCLFGEGELHMSCATPLGRAEDKCPAVGDGGGLEIGFNNRYLLDALKAAPTEKLSMCLNTASTPCVLRAEDGSEVFVYMILPVRLKAGE